MAHEKPIGIDLGTSNSAMAWVDVSGRSQMITNAEGELITPSIVFFSETEVVVGKNARSAIVAHPEMVAQWVKRDMGAPFYSHPIRGHYLPPEVIQACILRKLKADLGRALGPDTRTVITVPAYFDELRRKATADAGDMAGLRVLDIVNEPTAAALAFGEALGYLDTAGLPREDMHVIVYDLGGGTFDATLLHLAMGDIKTIATDGDVQLGGHDWDQRLVDYAAESFVKSYQVDPRKDPATLNRLYQDAMEAKHTLSARNRASMRIEFDGRSSEVQIVREQFEEMTADLLERTAYTSRQLLAAAGLEWKDVKRVLLVGGSSRMPMVSRMLKSMTGVEPDRTVNPDEAVARGAALYANHLLAKEEGSHRPIFRVSNVNAHSLGIEGIDTETLRKKNVVLIPRNSQLPAKHTERFCTKSDGQRSIVLRVLEGESSLPGECIAIGRTVVRDLPAGLPKGWPVEVTFEYAPNGRLTVRALVPGTQHQAKLELERDVGLSGEGMAHWKVPISAAAGFDAFEQAVEAALNKSNTAAAKGASGIGGAGEGWVPPNERSFPPPLPGAPPGSPPLSVPAGAGLSPTPPSVPSAGEPAPSPTFAPGGVGTKGAPCVELALPPTLAGSQRAPEPRPEKPSERPPEMRVQGPSGPPGLKLGVPAMPPASTPAMPLTSTPAMPPLSTPAMPPTSTPAMPPLSTPAMPPAASVPPMPPLSTPAASDLSPALASPAVGATPQPLGGWSSIPQPPASVPSFLSAPASPTDSFGVPPPMPAVSFPLGEASAGAVAAPRRKPKSEPLLPRWLSQFLGHSIAALVALVAALVLVKLACIWFPEKFSFPLEWWR